MAKKKCPPNTVQKHIIIGTNSSLFTSEKKLHTTGAIHSSGLAFPIASYSYENDSIFFSAASENGHLLFQPAQYFGNDFLEPVIDVQTEKTELSVTIKGDMVAWDNIFYPVILKDYIRDIYAADLSDLCVDVIDKAQLNGQSMTNGISLNY